MTWLKRGVAVALAPCFLMAATGSAWASSAQHVPTIPTSLRSDVNTIQQITQSDIWVQGTILSADNGVLKVDLANLKVEQDLTLNASTLVQVGPYPADTTSLLPGNSVKVYFHIDNNGNYVADLVTVTPTVVKGTLANLTTTGTGADEVQVMQVLTGSGSSQQNVNVDVVPATKVRILPPWNASEGLSAVNQLVAVGVSAPNGDVLATVVVGVVSASTSSGSGGN